MKRTLLAVVLVSAIFAPLTALTAAERDHGYRDQQATQARDTHYRNQRAVPGHPAVRAHGRYAACSVSGSAEDLQPALAALDVPLGDRKASACTNPPRSRRC
jgi:hypothetical protein